jgi:hypothetical protein
LTGDDPYFPLFTAVRALFKDGLSGYIEIGRNRILKKFRKVLSVSVAALSLFSCSGGSSLTYRSEDYAQYYGVASGKGLELYAWKKDGDWLTGLLPGTNRFKSVGEIEELQKYPCPLPVMKDILLTYTETERKYCSLTVVSVPPQESEIQHSFLTESEDYAALSSFLGIRE